MRFAENFFVANHEASNIQANELSVLIIVRHLSTPLIFNDRIWDKYGDFLIGRTQIIDLSNHELPNHNVKFTDLSRLGARFAVCAMASKNIAVAVAKNVNGDADAILKEFEANVSDTALMVPAGILMVNRAQEHGYTFSYCG
jgi:intracellular sulfur oxidation DsrE/DsrF family protein